jgi:hypothetical protein
MKTFSFRDSLRPLLLTGMQALHSPVFTPSLNDAPLAISLGAAKFGVRLRPSGDDEGAMDHAGMRSDTKSMSIVMKTPLPTSHCGKT